MLRGTYKTALFTLVVLALLFPLKSALAQNTTPGRANILFTQQDEVQEFNLDIKTGTGTGYQTGTAIGKISGTSLVTWAFQVVTPIDEESDTATISFVNTAIITDLDGDQITFTHVGTGLFHFAFFPDAFKGSGGTLTGTYEVTDGIGKYASWVGKIFNYKGVAVNPPPRGTPENPQLLLGTVYAEIYSNPAHPSKK